MCEVAQVVGAARQLDAELGGAERQSRLRREPFEETLLDRRQGCIAVFLQPQDAEPFVAQHHVERADAGGVHADPGHSGVRSGRPDGSQLRPVGGGREWDCAPETVRAATTIERLRAATAYENARSRGEVP